MRHRATRLAWALLTIGLGWWGTASAYRTEVRTLREMCQDPAVAFHSPYYLALFAFTALGPVAYLGAGAVILAWLVRYRGVWYLALQYSAVILMVARLIALWIEGGWPDVEAHSSLVLTPGRWGLVVLAVVSAVASLTASAVCMARCVVYPPALAVDRGKPS